VAAFESEVDGDFVSKAGTGTVGRRKWRDAGVTGVGEGGLVGGW
jgi:hypothetical protein